MFPVQKINKFESALKYINKQYINYIYIPKDVYVKDRRLQNCERGVVSLTKFRFCINNYLDGSAIYFLKVNVTLEPLHGLVYNAFNNLLLPGVYNDFDFP